MKTFALIAEGITDQILIEAIIEQYCGSKFPDDEIFVNPLQPTRDATDESRADSFGGWELVFEHCSSPDRIRDALALNDYLVVHLDTDSGEHPNYGLSLTEEGMDREVEALVADAREILQRHFGAEVVEELGGRIVYAIAVHSTECWMLAYLSSKDASNVKSCDDRVRKTLAKDKIKFEKTYKLYSSTMSKFRNKHLDSMRKCVSLDLFIDDVDRAIAL